MLTEKLPTQGAKLISGLDRILSIPEAPTHAVHMIDNWCGDYDTVYLLAFERNGELCSHDTGKPLIEYEGDKVVQVWPLVPAVAPAEAD